MKPLCYNIIHDIVDVESGLSQLLISCQLCYSVHSRPSFRYSKDKFRTRLGQREVRLCGELTECFSRRYTGSRVHILTRGVNHEKRRGWKGTRSGPTTDMANARPCRCTITVQISLTACKLPRVIDHSGPQTSSSLHH